MIVAFRRNELRSRSVLYAPFSQQWRFWSKVLVCFVRVMCSTPQFNIAC